MIGLGGGVLIDHCHQPRDVDPVDCPKDPALFADEEGAHALPSVLFEASQVIDLCHYFIELGIKHQVIDLCNT